MKLDPKIINPKFVSPKMAKIVPPQIGTDSPKLLVPK
jgi:hypothetical protein